MAKEPRIQDLTVYVLREGKTVDDAVPKRRGLKSHAFKIGNHSAELLIKRTRGDRPRWAAFFSGYVAPNDLGNVATVSGVLLLTVAARACAITFGQGRFFLADDLLEERFGLKVALNSLGTTAVMSVDKHSLDALGRHTRVQSAREARVAEFGVDVEQDLLRAVTGRPSDKRLGARMTGGDSLHVGARLELKALPALLRGYIEKSSETGYKKNYGWVDQVREVTDSSKQWALTHELGERLEKNQVDTLVLAVPEIVDWNQVHEFEYQGFGPGLAHAELVLEDLLDLAEKSGVGLAGRDALRKVRVRAVNSEGYPVHRWPLLNCLHGNMKSGAHTYVISGGRWYEVHEGYVAEVEEAFSKVPHFGESFPLYNDSEEKDYCDRVALTGSWAKMDRQQIIYGGGRSSIEFCDLFKRDAKTLVHVKRYGGSAPLSHLFAQALVSGETFCSDETFRQSVNAKLPDAHKLSSTTERPEGYKVVLGIVRPSPFEIPFFAKVNLRQVVRRLGGFGFDVFLAQIDEDPAFTKKKKEKKSKKNP